MNTPGTLDDQYFAWLYKSIGPTDTTNRSKTFWSLARQLYRKQFLWTVPNDDNREQDGKDLRHQFIQETDLFDVDPNWLELECSMLEMMIALAQRVSYEAYGVTYGEPAVWFWRMMTNIDIAKYSDSRYNARAIPSIDRALERVIDRSYNGNGVGGLFPLREAHVDQRRIELWYQMSSYLLEGERFHIAP